MGYFSFTSSDSTIVVDTANVVTPSGLLAQFTFVSQIIHNSQENFSLNNGDKKAIQELVNKCLEWMGPVWLNTLVVPGRNKQELHQLKINFQSLTTALLQTKLIDQKIYEDIRNWIDTEEFKGNLLTPSVFHKASEQSYYYESYDSIKHEQIAYLDTLKQVGLLSESGYADLTKQYTHYRMLGPVDVVSQCTKGFALDAKDLSTDGLQALLQIYRTIRQKLLPDFDFRYLHSHQETFTDEEYGGTYSQEIFNFIINGTAYQQYAGFTTDRLLNRSPFHLTLGGQVTTGHFKIVNDFLADQNSSQRLVIIDDKNLLERKVGSRIGFLLVDSSQAKVVEQAFPMSLEIHSTNLLKLFFDNSYNRTHLRQLVQEYQKIGIVPPMPADTLDALLTTMIRDDVSSKERILFSIPNTIARTYYGEFVYEGSEEEPQQVYRTFLNRLQAASRGNFTPTSIIDNVVKKGKNSKRYEWGFTLNQKSYVHKDTDSYDYLWECQYMKEVKQALLDSKAVGTFYPIGFEGNHFYIFLTPDQYTYLQTNHPDLFEK
jgi:hypothetical protein